MIVAAEHHFGGRGGIAMKKLFSVLLGVVALVVAAPAAADPPTAFPFEDVFPDVNPCTGDIMTVTIAGTAFAHIHDSRLIFHSERTITTSDGFAGHGTDSSVQNGQMFMFRQADIMTNASGGLFLAKGVIVVDLSTETVRVERFELTCIRPA
jgi:hypothetical protein